MGAKVGHIYRVDPGILGEFRISIEDLNFTIVFAPKANN